MKGLQNLVKLQGEVTKSVRKFMKYFCLKFGRADARSLVEACRVAVTILSICVSIMIFLSFFVLFLSFVLIDFSCACVGFVEG